MHDYRHDPLQLRWTVEVSLSVQKAKKGPNDFPVPQKKKQKSSERKSFPASPIAHIAPFMLHFGTVVYFCWFFFAEFYYLPPKNSVPHSGDVKRIGRMPHTPTGLVSLQILVG